MDKHSPVAVAVLACVTSLTLLVSARAESRSIQVNNNTKHPLVYLMASDVQNGDYKSDLLGTGIIGAGRTAAVNISEGEDGCRFNLRAILSSGEEIVRNGFDVCSETDLTLPVSTRTTSRSIQVHNNTMHALVHLMGSSIQDGGYKSDFLGMEIIGAGRTAVVNIGDGADKCQFNLKAILSNGEEIVRNDFDACRMKSWRINTSKVRFRRARLPLTKVQAKRPRCRHLSTQHASRNFD